MSASGISVVIPVWNAGPVLHSTINSIVAGRSRPFPLEIILVDDASTDGSCVPFASVGQTSGDIRIVVNRLHVRSGAPYALNRGAENASHSVLIFTASSAVFPANWDLAVRQHFHPRRLVTATIQDVQTGVRGYGYTIRIPTMDMTWITNIPASRTHVPVCSWMFTVISRDTFREMGGYDENLPLTGAAEPEFSVRAWLSGYEIILVTELIVGHQFIEPAREREFMSRHSSLLLQNYIRFAIYYLSTDLLKQSFVKFGYSHAADFNQFMTSPRSREAYYRREQLRGRLTHDFNWYISKFGLRQSSTPVSLANLPRSPTNLSVVILTHPEYLPYLIPILQSVRTQASVIDNVILIYNSADAPLPDVRNFGGMPIKIVAGAFLSPNHARNCGLSYVTTEWVCYVDGDNVPDAGYFDAILRQARQASNDVAVIYPDIRRLDASGSQRVVKMPEWNYWICRERSIVDTCSIWRTKALRQAGGWFTPADCLQDYATVMQLTKIGWKAKRAGGLIATHHEHANNLSKRRNDVANVLWNCRTHVVITPFAGRKQALGELMNWYLQEEFPPDTHVLWIDDSHDPKFHSLLWQHAAKLRERVKSVQVLKNGTALPKNADFHSLHDHIAGIYCRAFAAIRGDVYITVEDDVIAPKSSLRVLLGSDALRPFNQWAGVCAIYPSRNSKDKSYMVASSDKKRWTKCPLIKGFPKTIVEMGFVGAGFTAWSGAALSKALPVHSSVVPPDHLLGWDGTLCLKLTGMGYKVGIDGRVVCKHLC